MAALAATVAKLRRKDESWDKDELLDAVYWTRAGVAAVLGTVAGIAGAEGVGPFVVFGAAYVGVAVALVNTYLKVDPEEYGGWAAVVSEGFNVAASLFVLVWVVLYSLIHAA